MRVFLSYSRRDTAIADGMVADLEARGIEVDIDRRDLPYGEAWQVELQRFIHQADTIVWLASAASVSSKWCKWELGEAQRLSKRLLPVRITPLAPDQVPEALGRIHMLPGEGVYDPPQHLRLLVAAIETDRSWMESHTRLADRAAEWIARGRSGDRVLRGRALRDAEDWRDSKPERAPAPSNDTLDLLLQSRRAATRGLRRLLGVAVVIALGMVGLSAFAGIQWLNARTQEAEAVHQAAVATDARDAAQLESARSAVSAAMDMPARGQADQALLILLDAAETFGAAPPGDWQVAMHKALDAVDGRTIIPIPVGSLPFETRDGLHYEDPATHDLWRFDGNMPALALKGRNGDSSFVAMDTGPEGLIAIRANLDVLVIKDGVARKVGQFTGPPGEYPRGREGNDVWSIDPDGSVLRGLTYSAGNEPSQLLDTLSGNLIDVPSDPYKPIYYRSPQGRRYIVETAIVHEPNEPVILEIVGSRLNLVPFDAGLQAEARFADCMLGGNSRPFPFNQRVVDNIGETGLFRARCAISGETGYESYFLTTVYGMGSAGVGRGDLMVDRNATTEPYDRGLQDDIEYANPIRLGDGEFTWSGVARSEKGLVGAIFNRGVYVGGSFDGELSRQEPERPTMASMVGDSRIVVVEPRAGRLVIYDYTRGPWRPALHSPLEVQNLNGLVALLGANQSCVGYSGSSDVVLPDGRAVRFVQTNDVLPIELRFGERTIQLPQGQYCKRASSDWSRILVSGAHETRLVDLGQLAGGATIAGATIAMLPEALELAVVAPATGTIFGRLDEVNIQRWRIDGTGEWTTDIVYEGDLKVGQFEPNADGTALLIVEYQPSSYIRNFLYSVDARSNWVELIRDYKPSGLGAFAANGDIYMGGATLRMPEPAALIGEARANLAPACAPATAGDYRSSPCWPSWL